jgi:hypothetical protein
VAGNLNIKVGVQGRIILGPAGGAGPVEVPLRLALVQEGPEPKTVWTRLYRVPVTVGPGQNNVSFVHVEENLTVPLPRPAVLDAYVVYVGFDSAAVSEPPPAEKKKPAPKQKRAGPQ